MTATTLNSNQAVEFLRDVRIANIKDIRTVDTDLIMTLQNGDVLILTDGALLSLLHPDLTFVFKDGTLRLEQLFQQIEKIDLHTPDTCDGSVSCINGALLHEKTRHHADVEHLKWNLI